MRYLDQILLSLNHLSATTTTHVRHGHDGSLSHSYIPANAHCRDYAIPITVTSENLQWTGPKWSNDYELIDFLTVASSRSSPSPFGNATEETGSYTIGATFCAPKHAGARAKTVLIATHGLGYDRRYWNSAKDPKKYNFVQYATDQGYSVFFYDRVGVGSSSRISGYKTQPAIQTAILTSLAKSIQKGHYTSPQIKQPSSLVLIGHSFGSSLSNAALAQIPEIINATILTGFGLNGAPQASKLQGFAPRIARLQNPHPHPHPHHHHHHHHHPFATFDPAYVTTRDVFASITMFFKAPYYDPAVALFSESTKQPFSPFEILTIGPTAVPHYRGPVLVISGEFDFPTCNGDCAHDGALEVDGDLKGKFPNAESLETYVQPKTGHVLNFARNATGGFEVLGGWLERQGL